MEKRRKSRVQAQRKFAQGAYVPPQSTPPPAGCAAGAANASHRAGSAPGRVTKNVCSAKDLLTRMSLGKAHHHTVNWPIVVLEDCANLVNIKPDKKKLGVKKKHTRILRSTRKHASDAGPRQSSEGDSEDDTPLSHLQNPQVIPTEQVKSVPVEDTEGTASRNTKTETEKASEHVNITSEKKKTKPIGLEKCVKVIVQPLQLKRKVQTPQPPEPETRKRRLLKHNTKSDGSALPCSDHQSDKIQRSEGCATRSRSQSDNAPPCSTKNIKGGKRQVTQERSHQKSHKSSVTHTVKTKRPVSTSEKNTGNDSLKKLAGKPTLPAPSSTNPGAIPLLQNIQQENQYKNNDEDLTAPCFAMLVKSAVTSDKQNIKIYTFLDDDDDIENWASKRWTTDPVKLEAPVTSEILETSQIQPKPEIIDLTSLDSIEATNVNVKSESATYVKLSNNMNPVQPENTVSTESSVSFKLPSVPERLTKPVKIQCPLRPIIDIQELLNSDVACDTCRRCTLITMYKNILEKEATCRLGVPVQDKHYQKMTRREKLCNILTIKRLPLWLSSFEMALINMHMYENEHKASTSKSETVEDDEDADPLAEKAISWLEYLNRCLINGLKLEELHRSSLTIKPEVPNTCQKQKPLRTPRIPLIELTQAMPTNSAQKDKTDNVVPAASVSRSADSIDQDSETTTASAESRFRETCSTPLLEVAGLVGNQAVDTNTAQARPEQSPSLPEVPGLVDHQSVDTNMGQAQPEQSPPLPEGPGLDSNQAVNTNAELTQLGRLLSSIRINQPKPRLTYEDALVFRPTLAEFKDPMKYIKSIEPEARKYGMCKIIPPAGFHLPCHMDETYMFGTTNQHLSRLYHRWGPNSREFAAIMTCLTSLTPRDKERYTKAPLFGGVEVDLVKLYHLVLNHGGIEGYLADNEKWARIAAQMNLSACSKTDWKKLQNIYCKHVLPYESLTLAERQAAVEQADEIWKIRVQNAILRAKNPLHYQKAMLSVSNLPEYEGAVPDADLADLYNICKPIYDKIEECTGKGRVMNFATFRRIAAHVERMRFPNGLPSTVEEIEKQYWEILTHRDEHVCVLSAFIDTSAKKLGHDADPKAPGGSHPWNLKRIGENPKNILCSLGKTLSVTVPTLCLNQLYSTSSWHKDPHKMAWMDYMHEGATKIWYSVPDSGAHSFRRAVERVTEASVQDKSIWLASDTTMIPPGNLVASGVPVYRIEQDPNEYIIVFPGAYASSISTGLSVAESIYFATDDWLDGVEDVFEEMRKDCEPAMFSCVLLMMNMARNPTVGARRLQRVCTILKRFIKKEFQARREAQWLKCKVTTDKRGREEGNLLPVSWPNQEECCLCRMPLVLSKMSKYDEPRKQMCITHGTEYMRIVNARPEEERPEHPPLLTLHYTNQELIEMTGTMDLYTSEI